MSLPSQALDDFAPAFFAQSSNRLVDRIVAEVATYTAKAGIKAPVRSMSSLILLDDRAYTVTELAAALGMSHAGAIKAVNALVKAQLVERGRDPDDKRRKPLTLTQAGRTAARETRALLEPTRAVYAQLFEEVGADLDAGVRAMHAALDRRSFAERLKDEAGERAAGE